MEKRYNNCISTTNERTGAKFTIIFSFQVSSQVNKTVVSQKERNSGDMYREMTALGKSLTTESIPIKKG